jgi:glucoamylase
MTSYKAKLLIVLFCLQSVIAAAQSSPAPDGPGMEGVWSRPDKQAFLATMKQNLWATVADGILTEVYYPTIDRAQTKDTQIMILIGQVLLEERRDFRSVVRRYPHSLAFHVISTNDPYKIKIEKDIILDPRQSAIVLNYSVTFSQPVANGKIYILHNPAADNTAGGDSAFVNASAGEMLAYQSDRRGDEPPALQRRSIQLLSLDRPATEASAGFEGVNDPWTQLHTRRALMAHFTSALNGNVAGTLGFDFSGAKVNFKFALSFAEENQDTTTLLRQRSAAALKSLSSEILGLQQQEWAGYLGTLNSIGQKFEPHVLVIRGLEDKIYPGAIVAGPSLPAIPDSLEYKETDYEGARLRATDQNGGYHRVWPRDAVQMSLGLLAAGDTATPLRVLRMLAKIQNASGTFPQNVWTDGQTSWNGFQLDQTAFPIILASRLIELGAANYGEFRVLVVNAADAIVKRGPWTDQDRWEENRGLSPNTIAVACQGLNEAAFLESKADPLRSQNYLSTCQKWKDSLLKWTFIENGGLGSNYFERMEISDDLSHMALFHIQNQPASGDTFIENEIIDGGFIQWIISGLVPPNDKHFTSSLSVYDRVARAPAFGGSGYLRYNHDGFGPGHEGRAWPLLSGERALAALVRGEDMNEHLKVLESAVTPAGMVCEQTDVSDCPLGWAHAEMLIVGRSLLDHKSFYIPRRLSAYK